MDKCTKIRYSNKSHAKNEIKKIKQKGDYNKASIYSCSACNGYHLTHCVGADKRAIRERISKFKIGQVWRNRNNNKDKFTISSVPANAEGLLFILDEFYLSEN